MEHHIPNLNFNHAGPFCLLFLHHDPLALENNLPHHHSSTDLAFLLYVSFQEPPKDVFDIAVLLFHHHDHRSRGQPISL
jgi:hypothetical protein